MEKTARIVMLLMWLPVMAQQSTAQQTATPDLPAALRFAFDVADVVPYSMRSTNTQRIYLNGYAVRDAEIITRVQIQPDGMVEDRGRYQATFFLTESTRRRGQPVGVEDRYESEYLRAPDGSLEIGDQYLMPVARNLPLFPDRVLEPGDTWTAPANEVHDLQEGYDIRRPLRFSFDVAYRYTGPARWRDQPVYRIEASYTIFHREQRDALLYPERVSGESQQTLYWDPERGRLAGSEEQYWIEFRLNDGRTITYEGQAVTVVEDARPLDRNTVVDTLQRLLDEAGIENTRVTSEDDGVILVLEDIGFPPDSASILPAEQERLEVIGSILARFPQNDLLITGHTALAGTEAGRRALSVARARAVGEFLLEREVRRAEQILFRGFGATRPIADNGTEAGRRRNRRVEIMVLDN